MGGLHDWNSSEEIRMLFFDCRQSVDTLKKLIGFFSAVTADKDGHAHIYDYHTAEHDCTTECLKLAWGEFHNQRLIAYLRYYEKAILSCEMKISAQCCISMWFEEYGIDMLLGTKKSTFSDLAKTFNCAIDAVYHSEHCWMPSLSQREIYMPDGNKVFSEETDYDEVQLDYGCEFVMKNKDFGKKSFVDVIEVEYAKICGEYAQSCIDYDLEAN